MHLRHHLLVRWGTGYRQLAEVWLLTTQAYPEKAIEKRVRRYVDDEHATE
ncbi:MAG: hypothetical protein AAGG50_12680 [Bacteroidota bacterium]